MDRCQAHSLDTLGTARTQHTHPLNALPPPTHTRTPTHTSTWLLLLVGQWKRFSKEHLCCPLGAQTGFVFFFVCVCVAIARPLLPADGVLLVGAAFYSRLERSSVTLWWVCTQAEALIKSCHWLQPLRWSHLACKREACCSLLRGCGEVGWR